MVEYKTIKKGASVSGSLKDLQIIFEGNIWSNNFLQTEPSPE